MMDETLSKLKERYERDPDSLIFAQYADYLRKSGEIEEAIKILEKGIQKHPNYATGYLILGRCYKDKELYEPALAQLEKAYELDHQNILSLRELADLHLKLNNIDNAIKYFENLLNLDPLDDETRKKLNELKKKKEEMEKETEVKISEMSKKDFFSYFDETEITEKKEVEKEEEKEAFIEEIQEVELIIPEKKEEQPAETPIIEEEKIEEKTEAPIIEEIETPKIEEKLEEEKPPIIEEKIIEEEVELKTPEMEERKEEVGTPFVETTITKKEEKPISTLEPRYTIELANIYFKFGFKEKGINVLEKILEIEPDNKDAKSMLMDAKGISVLEEIKEKKAPVEESIPPETDILTQIGKERPKLEGGEEEVNILGSIEKEEAELEKETEEKKEEKKDERPKTLKDIFGEGED
jgi:tetratricopeptide (TPR) repeat protein